MAFDPLFAFVFAGLFSPGPNVVLLTASGARFGFVRTLPHILGVAAGVGITSAVTGFGLGAALQEWPVLEFAFKCAAAVWILYMAWQLMRSAGLTQRTAKARPFTFIEAVLFQWVNPKIWAIAMAAAAGYGAGGSPMTEALRLGAAFSSINLGVCLFWTLAGALLALFLKNSSAWRVFNLTMAALLAASAVMVFL